MPYVSKVIKPTQYSDQHTSKKSQFYKGFSTVDPTQADTRIYDYDLIKQDILNQFNVRKGERVMNPEFGTVIWDLIFEPFTEDVKRMISNDVSTIVSSDPRAVATDVNVIEQEYGMLLEITMVYTDADVTDVLKVNFDKSTGANLL
jgi:phage baseplate assembly protein W